MSDVQTDTDLSTQSQGCYAAKGVSGKYWPERWQINVRQSNLDPGLDSDLLSHSIVTVSVDQFQNVF